MIVDIKSFVMPYLMYSMAAWGGRGELPSGLAGSKLSMQLEHMILIRP